MVCAWGSELEDERVPVRELCRGSDGASSSEGTRLHPVDADAVMGVIDNVGNAGRQFDQVNVGADDLEDRFLDTESVPFADLGDLSEAASAFGRGGVHVVRDEQFQSLHQPRHVTGELTSEMAGQ